MIKPKALEKGDKVAIVSLSWGGLGDAAFIHKYDIAKKRLEEEFGLEVVAMPHALKGTEFVYDNPQLRAQDLMDAFKDESIKAIICAIGGDDTVRILPYIDYEVIKNNPKIFMGYSDSTVNHFMMNKAGIVSFYGAAIMTDFAEYGEMFAYTKTAFEDILFNPEPDYQIKASEYWTKDFVPWDEANINVRKNLILDEHGYEVIQGTGLVTGQLLGGCIDVFPMIIGTEIWPNVQEWGNKILLIETSEDKPEPSLILYYLRNLGAQGILNVIKGIVVGKPQAEEYYEEYKDILLKVTKEFNQMTLPILYNVNIGHALPNGILPLGTDVAIDFDTKEFILIEQPCITKSNKNRSRGDN